MKNSFRVLLLEDVEADAAQIASELRRPGIAFSFKRVETKEDFLKELEGYRPDLVLSDYVLPSFEGLAALALVRGTTREVPFIFVSWQIHEDSVIEALKKGATDYVFKEQLSRLGLSVFRALREAEEREELKKSQDKIVEQERLSALGQMASGIAHDFSNALMPVLGYSELLQNHPEILEDRQTLKHYLEMINTSAIDAMKIVGRLREFYRKKEKAEELLFVDLNEVVRQTVFLTEPRWKNEMLAKGLEIKIELKLNEIPKIMANDTALRQAFTNLLFNAVDSMPKGGVIAFKTYVDGPWVTLNMVDTGVGMSEEVQRRCFEPFFSTKGKGGSGMGLAMVYGIVRRHGGRIEVESAIGRGTKFTLLFPFENVTAVKFEGPAVKNNPAFQSSAKLNILAVDDEPQALQVIREYLSHDGHSVDTTTSPHQGIEKFKNAKYDLVITDWAMPGMNGNEFSLKIKSHSPHTPVIILTGFGELVTTDGRSPKGADIILSKPATLAAIREALSRAVSAKL